jgi:hypothetical protein
MTSESCAAERLREIAAALGCPVETFYLPDSDRCEAGMTLELLRLWSASLEPAARERILIHARREAASAAVTMKAAE